MTDKEVMQMALDALVEGHVGKEFADAINALRTALAQSDDDGSCGDPDCDVCL